MNSKDFYKQINDEIKDFNKEKIIEILNNIIRKIPENKYEEILKMFDPMTEIENIDVIIDSYEQKFKLIDEFELYFSATGYEEYGEYYSPWGGDWVWEYTDEENIGELIDESVEFAIDLINAKKYEEAKKIIDLILYTNYQVLDEDGGDNFEISLTELKENGLINTEPKLLCLYAIYATYNATKDKLRAQKIYEYFKNENFSNIKVEDSFKLGTEVLKEQDKFWNDWINILLNNVGKNEYCLLKAALEYTNYNNYEVYLELATQNHPEIYIDIFNHLLENNNVDKIITIGTEALKHIDDELVIKNDIALFLAQYDQNNKEKYIIEAFKANTNIPNLIRIINNGYLLKYKDLIGKTIRYENDVKNHLFEPVRNKIDKEMYYYLNFFLGNFELFYEECLNHNSPLGWSYSFVEKAVYLWLLVLDNESNFKLFLNILSNVFEEFKFRNNLLFLDDEYILIFKKWKENFVINDPDKYIKWLEKVIDARVDAIISGGHRKSYFKAAHLIVALGEVLESNNITTKNEFIDIYHKKYHRHSAFRKELNIYNVD